MHAPVQVWDENIHVCLTCVDLACNISEISQVKHNIFSQNFVDMLAHIPCQITAFRYLKVEIWKFSLRLRKYKTRNGDRNPCRHAFVKIYNSFKMSRLGKLNGNKSPRNHTELHAIYRDECFSYLLHWIRMETL